jgi:hypothetical protein
MAYAACRIHAPWSTTLPAGRCGARSKNVVGDALP